MLVVKCGCGSTVLSPVSTDQFKRSILVFSLITKQSGDTTWTSVREMHCALEVGSFLFLCNLPIWKSSEFVCPLFSLYMNKSSQRMLGVMAALIAHKNSWSSDSQACSEVSLCISYTFLWWYRKWTKCWERATGWKHFIFFCVYCT